MAFTNEVVFVGGGILLATCIASYVIGKHRGGRWGYGFFAAIMLILVALNLV